MQTSCLRWLNKRLGGTLTIGLPEQIAETLPLPRELLANKLFTASGSEEGYIWVNMNLSGTIDAPQEDLSVRTQNVWCSVPE